jgi:16S rRNA (cytosine967-C5)-methyltransferase
MRREPDLRWRLKPEKMAELPALQLQILRSAARFVRPGGRLVYATCSPLRAEDEAVVADFLAGEPGFRLAEPATTLPPALAAAVATPEGFVRLWPDRHGTGAFFAALLLRRA